ncbi:MAG: plasmid maintenance system killer protein [Candidatus Azotimanducaceae bacterium]|jgi:plasmid maintenance system killer protein
MKPIKVIYMPSFIRELQKLESDVQTETAQKVKLFEDSDNHKQLRVHKLKGRLKNKYSFSVTYSHRIVFLWEDKKTAVFLSIGDHDVYK